MLEDICKAGCSGCGDADELQDLVERWIEEGVRGFRPFFIGIR